MVGMVASLADGGVRAVTNPNEPTLKFLPPVSRVAEPRL
jgi:hypothetical protein